MGEIEEDKRDRREMDEIRRRIEERKLSKELCFRRTNATDVKTPTSGTIPSSTREPRKVSRKDTDQSRKVEEKVAVSRRGSKKSAATHAASSAEDAVQREEAISWVSGTMSKTLVVKPSVGEKGVMCPKATLETPTDMIGVDTA